MEKKLMYIVGIRKFVCILNINRGIDRRQDFFNDINKDSSSII